MEYLPNELLIEIFYFLESYRNCVFFCGLVCQKWREILIDEKNYTYLREFEVPTNEYKESWQYRLPYINVKKDFRPLLNTKQQEIHSKFLDFLGTHDKLLDIKSEIGTGKSTILRLIGIWLCRAIPHTVILITIGRRQEEQCAGYIQGIRGFVPVNMQITRAEKFPKFFNSLLTPHEKFFLLCDEVLPEHLSFVLESKQIKKCFCLRDK